MINNLDSDVDGLIAEFIARDIVKTREEFFQIIGEFVKLGWLIKTGEVGPFTSFRLSDEAIRFVNGGPLGETMAQKLKSKEWLKH